MIPGQLAFTMYVGTTFGPYFFYFNATKTQTLGVVTVDASTDIFTLVAHGLINGDQVRFTSTGQRPYPLTTKFYFVREVTADTFTVAETVDAIDALDITNVGFGVHTLYKRGIPTDITGWNIWSWVKHSVNDPDTAKIIDLNPQIVDELNGVVRWYVSDEDTGLMYNKVGDHVQSLIVENLEQERLGPYILGPFYIRRISTKP